MCADGFTELSIGAAPKAVPRISLHAQAPRLRPAISSKSPPNRRRARIQMRAPPHPGVFPFPKERPERWLLWEIAFTTVKWAEHLARVAMARAVRGLR